MMRAARTRFAWKPDRSRSPRGQCSLGYTPEAGGSGYRKIHVTVKPKGLVAQARDGYCAGA